MRTGILFLVFVCCFKFQADAQMWQKLKYAFRDNDSITKKDGIFLFPLLYYTPDTRFAAGAVGVYYFNTAKNETEESYPTRLSFVKLLADYTQNRQLDIWSSWNVFSDQERYLFKGEVRYRNFPDRYYGIGNSTTEEQEEFYSFDLAKIKLLAMKQFAPQLFIGFDYDFTYEYNFIQTPGGELIQGTVAGYNGGVGSGLGGVLTYDTRDNVVNAYEGMLFEASSYFFNQRLGGSFNFFNLNFTFNKYWEFRQDHVLAFNAVLFLNFGEVPFLDMARVGGDDILRGYARNRFRDHHFSGIQLEYRFPVWWRFGMVVFAGAGDVFRDTNDLSLRAMKYSFGAGIRFSVNKKERLNVRFDYGFGKRNNAFYIMLTEAF
jgi:hypothetical protein